MTRSEFIEDVGSWCELEDFCGNYDMMDMLGDVYGSDDYVSYVDEDVITYLQNYGSFEDLYLSDMPGSQSWDRFIHYGDGLDEWSGSDDGDRNFQDYKNRVLEEADDRGDIWEDEDDEFPPEPRQRNVQEPRAPQNDVQMFEIEDFSYEELIGCAV